MQTAWIYRHINLVIFVCIALLASIPEDCTAGIIPGVNVNFSRNNTAVESSEVASNVLGVKNNTGKSVRFHLNYSIPAGWVILGQTDKEFEIATNDSLFIPVRIIPDKHVKGGTSYVITVTMMSDKNIQFAAQNWYVSVPSKSVTRVYRAPSSGFRQLCRERPTQRPTAIPPAQAAATAIHATTFFFADDADPAGTLRHTCKSTQRSSTFW